MKNENSRNYVCIVNIFLNNTAIIVENKMWNNAEKNQ